MILLLKSGEKSREAVTLLHELLENESESYVIYGAQMVAATLYTVMHDVYDKDPLAFVVSDVTSNPDSIDGIAVIGADTLAGQYRDEKVIIATPPEHHDIITKELAEYNISNVICVNSGLYNRFLHYFYTNYSTLCTSEQYHYTRVGQAQLQVYRAAHEKDKVLQEKYCLQSYEKRIQVGTALSKKMIEAEVYDNTLEHISERNPAYCELTAAYWVWKNVDSEYKGISHYRRVFEDTCQMICDGGVDVILPYPSICYPDITWQHRRYLTEELWEMVCKAVERRIGTEQFEEIIHSQTYYHYNSLIARKEIFDEYCSWMFQCIEEVEEMCIQKQIALPLRWAGYVGEELTTIYWKMNLESYEVVHIGLEVLN